MANSCYRRDVAQESIQGRKPEELVASDLAADSEAKGLAAVGRAVGLGGELGNLEPTGGRGLLHPLREGILRSPQTLPVPIESLTMQAVVAVVGVQVDGAAGR